MRYTEELHWILDKENTTHANQDERYAQNIAFVHSLGLKCDCVGWSTLDLQSPDADRVLDAIKTFCKKENWSARGIYTRTYAEPHSDWYALKTTLFCNDYDTHRIRTLTDDGDERTVSCIQAYRELSPTPKWGWPWLYVPARFRDACLRSGIPGLDFCWLEDKGRYQAEQYFEICADQRIPRIGWSRDLNYANGSDKKLDQALRKKLQALGGYLPELIDQFYDLQISLPNCYLASDMPAGGIAYAYYPRSRSCTGRNVLLIHKATARQLIQEKAIPANCLEPVPILDHFPDGYPVDETQVCPRLTDSFVDEMFRKYEKWMATPRPVRQVSEQAALKVLRKAKREQKSSYRKGMPKAQNASLLATAYSPLAPYYLVSHGGLLSDEYEFLTYDQATEATREFMASLEREELLEEKPEGIVFVRCIDGDVVLLGKDEQVVRFSHETPEVVSQWPSLAQFFFDAVMETN